MPDKPTYEELKNKVEELERAEAVRKHADEELAQIFSMSLDIICIIDLKSPTFLRVSPSVTDILGHSEEELIGKSFFDFLHPDDIDSSRNAYEQKVRSGIKILNFANRCLCKDRSYRWISWVSHPNPEKRISYCIGRDITEWKRKDARLKQGKALLDAAGRIARVGGWELDIATMAVKWTEQTYRIHEVPQDRKIRFQEAINFYHSEDKPKLELAIQRSIDHGEPYSMELRFISAKGKRLWIHTACEPEVIDGKTTRLSGIFQDITGLKLVNEKLQKSEEKYRNLFDSIRDGILLTDTKRTIIDCNQTFMEWFGYEKKEILGRTPDFIYGSEQDFQQVGRLLKSYLELDTRQFTYTATYKRKSGELFPGETNGFFLENETGEIVGYIGITKDITRRKITEKSLQQANEELRHKTAELEDTNTALKILLQKRDLDNRELQENINSRYELMIEPFLNKLKNSSLGEDYKNLVGIIETNLKEIIDPYIKKISNPMISLTPSEIQIATMIKQGFTNKEIALVLNCSKRTVDTHRDNIRKKLDLTNKKINLKTFLLSL